MGETAGDLAATAQKSAGATLADWGESRILAAIAKICGQSEGRNQSLKNKVHIGVGDDAAVLAPMARGLVATTDTLVEDIDFRMRWASWKDLGHKAAEANLSDLAAMGAIPRGLLLTVVCRSSDKVQDLLTLVRTVRARARAAGAELVGGDLSASKGARSMGITALGETHNKGVLRQKCGEVGDIVAVSGSLGDAAIGLKLLESGDSITSSAERLLVRRQLRPTARLNLAAALMEKGGVRACTDISDGLLADACRLPKAGLCVAIDPHALPFSKALEAWTKDTGENPNLYALQGGEDFELVVAYPPKAASQVRAAAKAARIRWSEIGCIVDGGHVAGLPKDALCWRRCASGIKGVRPMDRPAWLVGTQKADKAVVCGYNHFEDA